MAVFVMTRGEIRPATKNEERRFTARAERLGRGGLAKPSGEAPRAQSADSARHDRHSGNGLPSHPQKAKKSKYRWGQQLLGQKAECPLCGRKVTRTGLPGHLFGAHEITQREFDRRVRMKRLDLLRRESSHQSGHMRPSSNAIKPLGGAQRSTPSGSSSMAARTFGISGCEGWPGSSRSERRLDATVLDAERYREAGKFGSPCAHDDHDEESQV